MFSMCCKCILSMFFLYLRLLILMLMIALHFLILIMITESNNVQKRKKDITVDILYVRSSIVL